MDPRAGSDDGNSPQLSGCDKRSARGEGEGEEYIDRGAGASASGGRRLSPAARGTGCEMGVLERLSERPCSIRDDKSCGNGCGFELEMRRDGGSGGVAEGSPVPRGA